LELYLDRRFEEVDELLLKTSTIPIRNKAIRRYNMITLLGFGNLQSSIYLAISSYATVLILSKITMSRRPPAKPLLVLGSLSLAITLWAYQSGNLPPYLSSPLPPEVLPVSSPQIQKLLDNAKQQTEKTNSYDPAYVAIPYPNGDVAIETGVCTDVVIRGFRAAGVDLQQVVHEDMVKHFSQYPQEWGLTGPDPNIDHRRVPNLMRYFDRQGKSLPVTRNTANYQPGDVVVWDLGGGNWHMGLVSNVKSRLTGRSLIIHNVGEGARQQDVLFAWPILGHHRYF
jgi:uncharacterized protein